MPRCVAKGNNIRPVKPMITPIIFFTPAVSLKKVTPIIMVNKGVNEFKIAAKGRMGVRLSQTQLAAHGYRPAPDGGACPHNWRGDSPPLTSQPPPPTEAAGMREPGHRRRAWRRGAP